MTDALIDSRSVDVAEAGERCRAWVSSGDVG